MLCSGKDTLDLVVPDEINQRHTETSRVLCGGRHFSLEPTHGGSIAVVQPRLPALSSAFLDFSVAGSDSQL